MSAPGNKQPRIIKLRFNSIPHNIPIDLPSAAGEVCTTYSARPLTIYDFGGAGLDVITKWILSIDGVPQPIEATTFLYYALESLKTVVPIVMGGCEWAKANSKLIMANIFTITIKDQLTNLKSQVVLNEQSLMEGIHRCLFPHRTVTYDDGESDKGNELVYNRMIDIMTVKGVDMTDFRINFTKAPSVYIKFKDDEDYNKIVAVYDILFHMNERAELAFLRICTIKACCKEQALLSRLLEMTTYTDRMITYICAGCITMDLKDQMDQAFLHENELFTNSSIIPYNKCMSLVYKSSFSANVCPDLLLYLSTFMAFRSNPSLLNTRITKCSPFLPIKAAILAFLGITKATGIGLYIVDGDAPMMDSLPATTLNMTWDMIKAVTRANIKKLEQDVPLTQDEISIIKAHLVTENIRPGSIGAYIDTCFLKSTGKELIIKERAEEATTSTPGLRTQREELFGNFAFN